MIRSIRIAAVTVLTTAMLAGVAYAAMRPVPQNQPSAHLQNPAVLSLPGDVNRLEQVLQAPGPVNYKVLVIDSTDGEDKTAYLDRVAGEWNHPGADTLLLVLFTADNYDIRFFMGANFRANGVTVEEMLGLVRSQYFTGVRLGDVAGGLVSLVEAVNQRMGAAPTPAAEAWSPKMDMTVTDPFGGPRHSAAGQGQIVKALLTAYLSQFKAAAVPEQERLQDFRFDESALNVTAGSDTDALTFLIKYDVLPVSASSAWMAGNGQPSEDGWIVGKTQYMVAVRHGALWRLEGLITSPKPQQ